MSSMPEILQRERLKRDRRILKWLEDDKSVRWMASKLELSTQRVYAILKRMGKSPA